MNGENLPPRRALVRVRRTLWSHHLLAGGNYFYLVRYAVQTAGTYYGLMHGSHQ
jgi:hypothetical protein